MPSLAIFDPSWRSNQGISLRRSATEPGAAIATITGNRIARVLQRKN
jgi:hypothetical protein